MLAIFIRDNDDLIESNGDKCRTYENANYMDVHNGCRHNSHTHNSPHKTRDWEYQLLTPTLELFLGYAQSTLPVRCHWSLSSWCYCPFLSRYATCASHKIFLNENSALLFPRSLFHLSPLSPLTCEAMVLPSIIYFIETTTLNPNGLGSWPCFHQCSTILVFNKSSVLIKYLHYLPRVYPTIPLPI